MADLQVIFTENGSDFVIKGNDLSVIEGLQNMPIAGMFGGNPEQSTPQTRNTDEQAFDWWGNRLLMNQQSVIQYNSTLERTLSNRPISSSTRTELIQVIKRDLSFMNQFASLDVDVFIIAVDQIRIWLKITQPNNLESNEFTYIWNATSQELTVSGLVTSPTDGQGVLMGNILNYDL
jgi:hypothetical protein